MANNRPLGINLRIQSLDEQFNLQEKKEDRSEDIVVVTGEELDTEQAKTKVRQEDDNPYYQVFQRGFQTGKSAEELTAEATDVGLKGSEFVSNPEFVAEQALALNDYSYSAVDARVSTNYQIAEEIISDRIFDIASNKSPFQRTMDSVDRFLRDVSPVSTYEGITAKTESQSRDILNNAVRLSPVEFREWFNTFADDVAKEGLFTEDTIGALEDLKTETLSAGLDINKGANMLFAALDLVGVGQLAKVGAKAVINSSLKSSTAVGRVASIRGSEAASEAAENVLVRSPDPEVLSNVAPSNLDLAPQPVRPSAAKFTEKFSENEIIKGIDDLFQKGAFGRVADAEAIKSAAKDIADKYTKKISNPIFDYKVVDEGLGNYVTSVRFGRASDGTPFRPLPDGSASRSIQKVADEINEVVEKAEVAPVDPTDLSKGYVINVDERVNVSGLPKSLDEKLGIETGLVRNTLGRVMNNSIMGSAAMRDNQRLASLAQMSESSRAAVKEIIDPYQKAIQRLNSDERFAVQAVYTELRDGKDASLRTRYTDGEFAVKYKQLHPRGQEATPRAIEAYDSLAAIEEADYLLKTTTLLNRYVEKGYQNSVEVFDNYFAPAKKVRRSDVPEDAKLYDAQGGGGKIRVQDLDSEDIPIWKLDKPTSDGQEFVVYPKTVRIIEPTDVMGYNVGGSRSNPNLNYFVVIGEKRLKALMGTFSEKQARTSVEQLGRIQRAAIDNDTRIDEIIQANNDWNPSIQNFDDLKKLADDEGWDLTRGQIAYKGRNDDVLSGEVEGSDIFTGMKADDYVNNDMRRNDRVLMEFGGGRTYNEDPINSVLAQMGNSVFTYSNRAYARNAMVGWVKKTQERGRSWFPDNVSPNDYETLFREAKISGTDEFSRRMSELRDITLRRLNMKDEASLFMERQGQGIAEFVFDKTGKKLNLNDPSNFLLKVGFQSAFGFMNVSQFFMQGFHVTTIMAISPKFGSKGAAMTLGLRGALRAKTPEQVAIARSRIAKAYSLPEKDAEELIEFIRTSGRAVVDGDAIEDGTGVGFGISGWSGESMRYSALSSVGYNISKLANKGLDMGLYPFKQGERLSRLTAINTAFLEFKDKFPKVSALSDEARLWITRREQDLTFNMSSLSRSKAQSGFMRVPTQWLSYTMRSMENIFVGRNFTAAERARLFGVLVPMHGLTGFGAETAADYIGEKIGIPPDSSLYIGLKYGMLDALSDVLPGGVEIGLGQRLAPVGAITDTYKKITEEPLIVALGGPSGEIAYSLYDASMGAISSLLHGHTATLTDDAVKILRQPSGIDNAAKAIGIFNNGVYRSKNGIEVDAEMSVGDGIVALTGFTPLEVVENYQRMGKVYNGNKKYAAFRKEVNRDAERIFNLMEGDRADVERAIKLMEELHERISFSGFSASQTAALRRATGNRLESSWQKIQGNLLEQDRYAYEATKSILKGTE